MKKSYLENLIPKGERELFIKKETQESINETLEKRIKDFDIYDFIDDIQRQIYDQFVGQYKTLHKKVNDALDKKIEALAEKIKDEKVKMISQIRTMPDGPDKQTLQNAIERFEQFDTKEEIWDIVANVVHEFSGRDDMTFLDFIMQDY